MIEIRKFSKSGALALLVFLLLAVWSFVVLPYTDLISERAWEVQRRLNKIAALNDLVNNKQLIYDKYRAIKNNRSLDRVYLNQGNGVVAEAKLQGIIRRLVERNGSVLTQSSLKKTDGDEKSNTITMQITMRGSVDSTYKIFHAIENGWPVMIIKNAKISSVQNHYALKSEISALNSSYEVTAYVK